MKTIIENYKREQFEIGTYFTQEFKGRGGWNINCEVSFKGENKIFHHYINDSQFIDEISRMRANDASWDDIQNAYKDKSFDELKEIILEWCEDVNENEEVV